MFKLQKEVTNKIGKQSFYKDIDISTVIEEKNALRKKLGPNIEETYYQTHKNDGRLYISIDIRSANYSMLKKISKGEIQEETWPEYFRKIYPFDIRYARKKNQTEGLLV